LITESKVTVWAETHVTDAFIDFISFGENESWGVQGADHLASGAGKICYTTKPNWRNPSTDTVDKYIKNILDLKHYSVLAHASVTLYIEGVSRALTHELIRSRFLGFSQLSQRYCDSSEMDWVCPPLALDDTYAQGFMEKSFRRNVQEYEMLASHFMNRWENENVYDAHMLKKRAREAARAVLPNSTETKLVCSGNLRAWRDFLWQRLDPTADLEIMRLGSVILEIMKDYAPSTFSDFEEE
jgi:thymidylate synthase (FAD)